MKIGDKVADFELADQQGNNVALADLLSDGPAVLYFYIKAKTPGWTIESKHFRDLSAEFAELGASIVGVSADPVGRLQEFDEENELGFKLLSDADKRVAKSFGVKRMGPLPNKRATFVVDTDRTVLASIMSETSMEKHADEALEVLRNRA